MRLLIVEDDPDGRELLAELFRMHDWDVTQVPTTHAAMTELRQGGIDVVISDENLEGQSGSSMLRRASAEGLLCNVGVLMYTAEPGRLEVPPGVRVLRKPLGISKLLDEAQAVAPEDHRAETVPAPPSSRTRACGTVVELVLYVTSSPSSRRALRDLQRVLDDTRPRRVRVVVHNLEQDEQGRLPLAERVAFTPILVQRRPGEPERFFGALDSTRSLATLIQELDAQDGPPSHAMGDSPPSSRA
jgi:CheY-like chemotaxis protein